MVMVVVKLQLNLMTVDVDDALNRRLSLGGRPAMSILKVSQSSW